MLRAGRLRHRIRIKNPTQVAAGAGNFTTTWPADSADDGEVWADIETLTQLEKFWAAHQSEVATHKITVRYTTAITTKSRLVEGSRQTAAAAAITADHVYHVVSLIPDRLKRELQITVMEEVA